MTRPELASFHTDAGSNTITISSSAGIPFLLRLGRFLFVLVVAPSLLLPRQESSSIMVRAFPGYAKRVPNGEKVRGPSGESWAGVGHLRPGGGGELNPFGKDFAAAGHTWTIDLCQMDSDCDGFTNGVELGDPTCEWSEGDIPTFDVGITHPGIADRVSEQQRTRNRRNRKLNRKLDEGDGAVTCKDFSLPSGHQNRTFLMPSYDVPKDDTTYAKYAIKVDFELYQDEYAVLFRPVIQNPEVVHHIILYNCDSMPVNFLTPSTATRMPCTNMVYAWAIGGGETCMPKNIGMELDSSKPWFMMDVHYDNPKELRNIVDSSGIEMTTIAESAAPDYQAAGWLWTGIIPSAGDFYIPPGRDSFEITADCTYPTIPADGINVFSMQFHAHELGRKIWSEVQRPVFGNQNRNRNRNLDASSSCPSSCSEGMLTRCNVCFDDNCCSTQDPTKCTSSGLCCSMCAACDGCQGCYEHDEQCNPDGFQFSELEADKFDLGCNTRYDFDLQELVPLFEPQKLYSTDKIVTHCVYDSTARTKITRGGDETENEMCIGFFLYYPIVRSKDMRCLVGDPQLAAGPGMHTCNMPGQPESFLIEQDVTVSCPEREPGEGPISSSPAGISDLPLWLLVHIVCVMTGMGVLMPAGVVMAISFRNAGSGSEWFWYHKMAASAGLFFLVLGCCAAFWGIEGTHWMTTHHKVGLAVLVLALAQPLNAYFRPKPNSNNTNTNNNNHNDGDLETAADPETTNKSCTMPNARTLWEIWHKSSGRLTVVGAWTNTFLGINLLQEWYGASDTTSAALRFLQVASIALLVGVVVYRRLFHRPSPPVDAATTTAAAAATPRNNNNNAAKNHRTKK